MLYSYSYSERGGAHPVTDPGERGHEGRPACCENDARTSIT
jgi:hypothetical protein